MVNIFIERINKFLDALVLVFSDTKYPILAFVLAIAMAVTYPLLFPIAVGAKVSLFVFRGNFFDVIILASISMVFGITVAMQLYHFRRTSGNNKKTGVNLIGIITGFLTSKACCLLPLILLAIGATAGIPFFIKYTTEIRLFGLSLLGLSMYWTSLNISKSKDCCTYEKSIEKIKSTGGKACWHKIKN